jgi:imidazolonepropionase-like amidohydrolase
MTSPPANAPTSYLFTGGRLLDPKRDLMEGFEVLVENESIKEANNAGLYAAAHLYTDEAIARAVDCGVHSLEHCNLIQPETTRRRRACI